MMVTDVGSSGLRKAYKSVLSASGSLEINGASRWLEADAREVKITKARSRKDTCTALRRIFRINIVLVVI
jgi:hypothetical protein